METRAIIEHSQYVCAVYKWHDLHGRKHLHADFWSYINAKDGDFSWVDYGIGSRKIYVPAHCVAPIMLLNSPYAKILFKAYCLKHGLDVPARPDSAVV
jgi:hypothetical protein